MGSNPCRASNSRRGGRFHWYLRVLPKPSQNGDIPRSGTRLQTDIPQQRALPQRPRGPGRRRAELLKLDCAWSRGLEGQSRLLDEKRLDGSRPVAEFNTGPVQVDVEARLGGVVGVTAMPG